MISTNQVFGEKHVGPILDLDVHLILLLFLYPAKDVTVRVIYRYREPRLPALDLA
jgi:hypothetical protein